MSARPRPTPETIERVSKALRDGAYVQVAAELGGITKSTYYRWLQLAQTEDAGPFRDFRDAVKKAIAESESECIGRIQQAANSGVWQASAWIAERRWPQRWARRDRDKRKDDTAPAGVCDLPDEKVLQSMAEHLRSKGVDVDALIARVH